MAIASVIDSRSIDRAAWPSRVVVVLVLLAAAVVTRVGRIGDPTIFADEQFYLLVGDRMWHGALPYVDLWDRKPILLFLIYAGLRRLSPDGIVGYQIGALLFAVATAFVIVLIARRFAAPRGALLAGVAYLLYLPLLDGDGGQSPVFYNLFLALGAFEVIRAGEAGDAAGVWWHGLRCMVWSGLAVQVKYTAAVEGVGYALWLMLLLARHDYLGARVAARTAAWVLVALAPTLAAVGFYVLIGHGSEFVQANFIAIFQKHQPQGYSNVGSLLFSAAKLSPLLLATILSLPLLMRQPKAAAPISFLLVWLCFAVADFLSIGNFFDHYALPLLVPAMVACAPLLATPIGGAAGIGALAYLAVLATGFPSAPFRHFDQGRIRAMVEATRPYAARGCIYVNDGPSILYLLTRSCLPSRYAFPGHLNDADEARATDAAKNMATLLASRPAAIFVADRPMLAPRNPATAAMLDAALARDYRRVAAMQDVYPERRQILYARKDLLAQRRKPR